MAKNDKIVRFPRPFGTTAMAIEYQKTQNEESLLKLQNYLINQWLMGNGVLCGITYDINSFSNKLGIDIEYIRIFMRDRLLASRIWDRDRQEELLNALLGEQLAWALEDRMEISHQLQVLRDSQGGKYTPYISSEVNKTLKLKLESSTSLQSIIRNLTGGNTTNIFNQYNQQNNVNTDNTISIEEARIIITESQKIVNKSEEAKLLEAKYDIKSLPEVVATKQEGVDTTKEGFHIDKKELNLITDNYGAAMEVSSKEHHELRREIEMRVDTDEYDPEMDIYLKDDEDITSTNSISFASSFLNSRK